MRSCGNAVHCKALDTHIEIFHKKMIANSWSSECIAADSTMEATIFAYGADIICSQTTESASKRVACKATTMVLSWRAVLRLVKAVTPCWTPIKRWLSKMLLRRDRALCKNSNVLTEYGLCPLWYQKSLTGEGMDVEAQKDDFQGLSHILKVF